MGPDPAGGGGAHLIRLSLIRHDSRHDDCFVLGEEQPLHELVLLVGGLLGEALADGTDASDWHVAELHPGPCRDDADLGGYQKAQSATGPRDGVV